MTDRTELDNFLERSVVNEVADNSDAERQEATAEDNPAADSATDKGDSNAATPAAEKDSTANTSNDWSKTAYLEEKRKRQELERQLEEVNQAKHETKDPDMFADPEGWTKAQEQKTQAQLTATKVSLSREMYAEMKPDYEAKEAKFVEMAQADSALIAKMQAAANPAKFAYETAAKQLALDAIGDPIAYEAKLREKILAELQGSKPAADDPITKKIFEKTPSLATASAARSNTDIPRKSLEEMFDR